MASKGPPASMRERNKAATRSALADAAVQLGMRHGLEAVRNEDIAELAGVSPRTFSNYFANKYEALTFRHAERMRFAADALRGRPVGEPLWASIRAAVAAPWTDAQEGLTAPASATVAELRLLFASRALQGEILKGALDERSAFALAIADRLGMARTDLYPRLLAAAVTVVTQVAIDAFLQSDPPVAQLPLVFEALDALAGGFPEPAAANGPDTQNPDTQKTTRERAR